MTLNIAIVDDHEAVREGLQSLLHSSDICVTRTFEGSDVLSSLDDGADVLMMDVRMPSEDGLSLLEKIRQTHNKLPIVLWSSYDNPTYVARAVALGATDYLLKSDSRGKIVGTLQWVAKENKPSEYGLLSKISCMMRQKVNLSELPPELPLTQREAQVLRHMGLGLSNKEIARSLLISVETVKEHVQNILRKMGANDRTDAAVRAIRLGIVE